MKSFSHYITEKVTPGVSTIYLDLDGVFANFDKRAMELLRVNKANFTETKPKELWQKIIRDPKFWLDLELMPGSKKLFEFTKKYSPIVLTGIPTSDPIRSAQQKVIWVKKNLGLSKNRIITLPSAEKQKFATTNGVPNVLIDDREKNIKRWTDAGGEAILHTSVSKSINSLKKLGF